MMNFFFHRQISSKIAPKFHSWRYESFRNSISAPTTVSANGKSGEILLVPEGKHLAICAEIGGIPFNAIELNPGSTYSQIKRSVAERIGLKTHEKLIGQSTLGNGSVLYCYLSKVSINIGSDCRMELVVKVVDDHCPNLLGLDVLVASEMEISLLQRRYWVSKPVRSLASSNGRSTTDANTIEFAHLNWENLLDRANIDTTELVSMKKIPSILLSVKRLIEQVKGQYYLKTIAGTGTSSSTKDGSAASLATVSAPEEIWVDSNGNIYFCEYSGNRVRKIDTSGIISTFIGTGGSVSATGTGGARTSVVLDMPFGIYGDSAGKALYFSGFNYFVWSYNFSTNIVSRIAGSTPGTKNFSGDGGLALSAKLNSPAGLFLSTYNMLYIADYYNNRVRVLNLATNIINTSAGNGTKGYGGDNKAATRAALNLPVHLWASTAGVMYIADYGNNRVRKVSASAIISTFIGTGAASSLGDNGPISSATINSPSSIQGDTTGKLYIVEYAGCRIRVVSASGIITTLIGTGSCSAASTVVQLASTATVKGINGLWLTSQGNLYYTEFNAHYVRLIYDTTPTALPTVTPSASPTRSPTFKPSRTPTTPPSLTPSVDPTRAPSSSRTPSFTPSATPSRSPSRTPSFAPSRTPSASPSQSPSLIPSTAPSRLPSAIPTLIPSLLPTITSSILPSQIPSIIPSILPTLPPTITPTFNPTTSPTMNPSNIPSVAPSNTNIPTAPPSASPTTIPTMRPSNIPTFSPSTSPSATPSNFPTNLMAPTQVPSHVIVNSPSEPPNETALPTVLPSLFPTLTPMLTPSKLPTVSPSIFPTMNPSNSPTTVPTPTPTYSPSFVPTIHPSIHLQPSIIPTASPSHMPSPVPTVMPSLVPTKIPSALPTSPPTSSPTPLPSIAPSLVPSNEPTHTPSTLPSIAPSVVPSGLINPIPSLSSTINPSYQLTAIPSDMPSFLPSRIPTVVPSSPPSFLPSRTPSEIPTFSPTMIPTMMPQTLATSTLSPTSESPSVEITHSTFPTTTLSPLPTSSPILSSSDPTEAPSKPPSIIPTITYGSPPTGIPTNTPSSSSPTITPSNNPSAIPTFPPTALPSFIPTKTPTTTPITLPPSSTLSSFPTVPPTFCPSTLPTDNDIIFSVQTNSTNWKESLFLIGAYLTSATNENNISPTPPDLGEGLILFGSRELSPNYSFSIAHYPTTKISPVLKRDLVSRAAVIVGDVTGDTYSDLIVCYPLVSQCSLFFGNENGLQRVKKAVTLTTKSTLKYDYFGFAVARVGDMNQDGIDDVLISAIAGKACYVIYGRSSPSLWPDELKMSDLVPGDDGYKLIGDTSMSLVGISVTGIADINGDRLNDIAISAMLTSTSSRYVIYVVFGTSIQGDVQLNSVATGQKGFRIFGQEGYYTGFSISSGGDMNGDNLSELLIGSIAFPGTVSTTASQLSYIVFGKEIAFTDIRLGNVSSLPSLEVLKMDGCGSFMVTGIEDVNDDGYDDVMFVNYLDYVGKGNAYIISYPTTVTSAPSFIPSSFPSSSPSTPPSLRPSSSQPSNSFSPSSEEPTSPSSPGISIPTRKPTIHKSNHPSNQPRSFPPSSRPPTRVPSPDLTASPTSVIIRPVPTRPPSIIPTRPPSLHPSLKPTNISPVPSTRPTSLLLPRSDYQIRSVNESIMTRGGIIFGKEGRNEIFEISSMSSDGKRRSGWSGTIIGGTGKKVYVIYPKDPIQPVNRIILQDFDKTSDIIDLSLLFHVSSKTQLSYLTNPLTFFLPDNQKIILSSHTTMDLSDSNFIFAQGDEGNESCSTLSFTSFVDVSFLAPIIVLVVCVGGLFTALHKEEDKVEDIKEGKLNDSERLKELDASSMIEQSLTAVEARMDRDRNEAQEEEEEERCHQDSASVKEDSSQSIIVHESEEEIEEENNENNHDNNNNSNIEYIIIIEDEEEDQPEISFDRLSQFSLDSSFDTSIEEG